MKLNKNLTINAPAQQVFAYWADFRHFQQFIPVIDSIEILDTKKSRWQIHAPLGHKISFESVITTFEQDKNLAWESHHADGRARGEVTLTESGDNTRVELNFEYDLHRGWMQKVARLANRFGFPSLAFDQGLSRIKEKIEKQYFTQRREGIKRNIQYFQK